MILSENGSGGGRCLKTCFKRIIHTGEREREKDFKDLHCRVFDIKSKSKSKKNKKKKRKKYFTEKKHKRRQNNKWEFCVSRQKKYSVRERERER